MNLIITVRHKQIGKYFAEINKSKFDGNKFNEPIEMHTGSSYEEAYNSLRDTLISMGHIVIEENVTQFDRISQHRKDSYTGGNLVNQWLQNAYQLGIDDHKKYAPIDLPDIEMVIKILYVEIKKHIEQKNKNDKSEAEKELMKPFSKLNDIEKENARFVVNTIYNAIKKLKEC